MLGPMEVQAGGDVMDGRCSPRLHTARARRSCWPFTEREQRMMSTLKFGEMQESALHVAAAHGADAVSRALMFAGADPNVVNVDNQTPLHLAAEEGHDVIVSDLLMTGANPNARAYQEQQYTPLHVAAWFGEVSCVSKLLLGGAEKDSRSSSGKTPLHLAAVENMLGVVEELLAAKADADIRADDRCRPLDIAAYRDSSDALRALLGHGGDIKACDDIGYTALHHAADIDAPEQDNGGAIKVLLEAGAEIEAKTIVETCKKTPLHVAMCRRTSPSGTLRALLEGGADVNARDAIESTPLHYACRQSNVGGVELLLRWGADETLVDEDGDTVAGGVGAWEKDDLEDCQDEEGRKADDQRIQHMLARAPADRSWRRRGWLVLARSRPDRVQLANDSRSNGGSSTKVAKAKCDGLGAGGGGARGAGDQAPDLACLVDSVVGIDAEGVFRLIVGFL